MLISKYSVGEENSWMGSARKDSLIGENRTNKFLMTWEPKRLGNEDPKKWQNLVYNGFILNWSKKDN